MSQPQSLPSLRKNVIRAFATIFRPKKVNENGIHFKKEYNHFLNSDTQLSSFLKVFAKNGKIPISFWYLIAQKAQIDCMLDSRFTLPMLGLIHLENSIKKVKDIDPDKSLEVKCTVDVPFKNEGSFIPSFNVEIYQKNELTVICESIYLSKRKSKRKKTKVKTYPIKDSEFESQISISKSDVTQYAAISEDYNPIHLSNFTAKLFGQKRAIIHGWHIAVMSLKEIERYKNKEVIQLHINFGKAIEIPSQLKILISRERAQVVSDEKLAASLKYVFKD